MMVSRLGKIFMGLSGIMLMLPILVVSASALNGGRSMLFPPQDPTLSRFAEFFVSEPVWRTALGNSTVIALCSAALATLAAWPAAYFIWKKATPLSKSIAGLLALPFAVPPIVFGVGLGFMWAFSGGLGTIWAGILSHAALFAALPLVTISIGLQSIDRRPSGCRCHHGRNRSRDLPHHHRAANDPLHDFGVLLCHGAVIQRIHRDVLRL